MAEEEHSESDGDLDAEGILDLNFVPDWARKPPQATQWRDEMPRRGGKSRGGYRDDHRRGRQDDRRPGPRRDRPPRAPHADRPDDRRQRARQAPPDEGRRPQEAPHRPPQDVSQQAPRPHDHRDRGPREHSQRPYRPPREPRLPLDIRIAPDQKGVQAVARRVHHSWMAYPVMDLATIFLSRPELSRIRIEADRGEEAIVLCQCQACGAVTRDSDSAMSHVISAHLEEYFEKEEKMTDPPSGVFVCVARCGLSGVLLGPPNHHSYAQRVQEVHNSRYPGMDMESYRARIETVRDAEVIEQWKEDCRKQTVYRRKDVPEGEESPELAREDAIALFRAEIAGKLIKKSRKASVPAPVALYMDDIPLRSMIRRLWEQEEHFPLKISFALRAAFRHMHLHVFKAGEGVHFVTRVAPSALDPEHVVEGIREVLLFLHDHPGSSRAQLVEGLRPGIAVDSETAHDVLSPLSWLIERGHIIEFFNGTLSVPLTKRPQSRSKPRRKSEPRNRKRHE